MSKHTALTAVVTVGTDYVVAVGAVTPPGSTSVALPAKVHPTGDQTVTARPAA